MTTTEPDIDPDGRYTVAQAARLLEVDRATIYRYIERGALKAMKRRKVSKTKILPGEDLILLWRITPKTPAYKCNF